jgi:hypothetical protein
MPILLKKPVSWIGFVLAVLLSGCATSKVGSRAPLPENGIEEYRQLTSEALDSVLLALRSLDQVGAQAGHCPSNVVVAFSDEVQRLQVESLRVRARSQAIQARGDAYFAAWSENLARMKDPQVRQLAERFRPELERSFARIKLESQQAGDAFRPFLHGLRELRVELEAKGGSLDTESATRQLRATRAQGELVLQRLGAVSGELLVVSRMLTPAKPAAKP